MADRGDTHYSVPGLNLWFFASSVILLVVTGWMMVDDYKRPWKEYQRQFRDIEISKAQAEQAELEAGGELDREKQLQDQVAAAEQALAANKTELEEAEADLIAKEAVYWRLNEEAKMKKAEFEWERFQVEGKRLKAGDLELGADELTAKMDLMNEAITEREAAETLFAAAQVRVEELKRGLDDATAALSAGTRELARVRDRLEQLDPQSLDRVLAAAIRDDIPGLDFIGPTIKVRKELPPDLTFELNFTKKQRIDMCHTCHMGIDRKGFEEETQPFTSHPRLDLYLTANSAHPMKEVGCTICHRGSGEALDFVRADHRPSDMTEHDEWHDEHHWEKQHHWDYPMLQSDMVEASCVQCHKDTMELIAEDAPVVSKGYQLFERYGCYACHKVDWFQTTRKPGPTLTNIQAKTSPEFMAAWIADPRKFRPTTWMPQIFHLENYEAEEVIATSKYGEGRDILGQEWNDTAVDAITAFIMERAPKQDLEPIPVQGDAYRGREVMRLTGCFACHNTAPWDGQEPETLDPALVARERNQHGPNLRGVATKLTPEWLYHWIKNPHEMWPETRMPNLRLTDQEAADIVAFMIEDPDSIFTDTPDAWSPQASPSNLEALQEQARWFFARDGRATIERRLEGQDPTHRWDDVDTLKVAVGEKLVAHYGCYSCHEIKGMEDMMPIGVELSNWGSKTVDKLDFGFAYKKKLGGRPKLDHHYREGWIKRKLEAPRSYDLEKVKNPAEKLRMGWFDFDQDEIDAIATFVVGLVDDEVQRARMVPTPAQASMNEGMRVVRQKNCEACHSVEPGRVTYRDEDGVVRTVTAQVEAFEDQVLPVAHADLANYLEQYAEEDGIEEIGFRLLATEPDVGSVGSKVFVPLEDFISATPSQGGEFVDIVADYYLNGGVELFDPEAEEDDAYWFATADPDGEGAIEDVDGEFRVYYEEPYDKVRWTYAPPVLWNEGHKVRSDWFFSFLNDVQPIRPQIRVRMPSFHYDEGEAAAVADYFLHKSRRDWPARYARELRANLGVTIDQLAGDSGLSVSQVTGIENGYQPDISANFAKLKAYGDAQGFMLAGEVNPNYESVTRRSPTYLAERAEELGRSPLDAGEGLAVGAVNCYQCHFNNGNPPPDQPIAWAPDLDTVADRLRDDWVHEWLVQPQVIYPGTSMPANFGTDPPQYQDVFPDSTNDQQIQVVLDWLYNLDQSYKTASN